MHHTCGRMLHLASHSKQIISAAHHHHMLVLRCRSGPACRLPSASQLARSLACARPIPVGPCSLHSISSSSSPSPRRLVLATVAAKDADVRRTMAPQAPSKLKVLCLHGYLQSAEIFRSRIGSLRKALKSRLEFEFVDAPFEAQGLPGQSQDEREEEERAAGGGAGGRSWWTWHDVGADARPSKAAHYTGWEEAERVLLQALALHRPDVVMGFSQGATATALLLATLARRGFTDPGAASLKGAVMVAGFLPRDAAYAEVVHGARELQRHPCLFVSGTSDALVPPERTQQLVDCFPPALASTYTHGGAHLVPTCSGDFKTCLIDYLDAIKAVQPLTPTPTPAPSAAAAGGAANSSADGGDGSGLAAAVGSLSLTGVPQPMHRVASQASLSASRSGASLASTSTDAADAADAAQPGAEAAVVASAVPANA